MKNLTTIIFTLFIFISQAQVIEDSLINGANYATQSFYSLENGEISNVDNKNWEVALSLDGQGAAGSAILLNELNADLWAVPQDTSFWASFDTTGYSSWKQLYNSDTTWINGAFNKRRGMGPNGTFDMGWGNLDPNNNFWTLGDSLYLCKLNNGTFKKIWVESLKQGAWNFRYADIDGNNDTTISITKTDYPNKNFIYLSLANNEILDREPDNNTWDLTFTGHKDELFPGFTISVVSVFSNRNIYTAKTHSDSYAEAILSTEAKTEFNKKIDNIGREWKNFSGGTWYLYDTISYFIYDNDSSLYRMVFTDFTGSAEGKSVFNKEKLNTSSIQNIANEVSFALYPNPSSGLLNIVLSLKNAENINFKIYDTKGQELKSLNKNNVAELEIVSLDIRDINSGLYFIEITGKSFKTAQQFIKK